MFLPWHKEEQEGKAFTKSYHRSLVNVFLPWVEKNGNLQDLIQADGNNIEEMRFQRLDSL